MCQKKINMTSNLIKFQWICTKCPSARTTVYHENRQVFRKYLLRNLFIWQRESKDAVVPLHVIKV
jgi:hypothetical protein